MDSGLYAAYSGLLARTQALDLAANNLANSSTNGFRAGRDTFRGVLASGLSYDQLSAGTGVSQVGDTVNSYGVLGASALDLSQGAIVRTGNPLDFALSGSGFFAVQTPHGIRYTRDGSFMQSPEGTLVTQAGEPVLDRSGSPINLPSGSVEAGPDGTLSVAGGVVAQLGIFAPAASSLRTEGINRFVADGATPPLADAGSTTLQQAAVEGSNQDTVSGTMQLMLLQRQAEMMQRALTVFHNDFDKTAAEELGKV